VLIDVPFFVAFLVLAAGLILLFVLLHRGQREREPLYHSHPVDRAKARGERDRRSRHS
jgi:hypothetical protein